MTSRRALVWIASGFVAIPALIVGVPNAIVVVGAGRAAHDAARAPRAEVALVLGASAYTDGTPTPTLADRLSAGAALYRDRRVDRVLVSGKRGHGFVDQVEVMRRELVRLGVPDRVIFTDHAGFDTWDSMVRARKVYEVRSAIVVTQGWHMPRALWLAKRAGLQAHGLVADRSTTSRQRRGWGLREVFARVKAVADVVTGAKPRFLGPKIPITGSAEASRG
jgi:SanA protein